MGTIVISQMGQAVWNQPDCGAPNTWDRHDTGRELQVVVLLADEASTLEALRCAARLPRAEWVPIRLLAPQVVAYPLPLHQPAIPTSVLAQRLRSIAEQAKVDITVDIFLCRDPWDAIHQALASPHLVVIGGCQRWWRTRETRIARRLRAEGHYVVFAGSK